MRTLLTFLALLMGTAATQAAADDMVAADFKPPPRDAIILLLVEKPSTAPLDRAGAMLEVQLRQQLGAAGYRSATIDVADYQPLETAEARALGEPSRGPSSRPSEQAQANALARLAKIGQSESHCAMLIRARIVLRQARLDGQYAQWDGRRRGLLFEDGVVAQNLHSHVTGVAMSGTTSGLSVELQAFDGSGARDFVTHGAMAIPLIWNVAQHRSRLRTDLFQDDEDVAEGLKIALAPIGATR